MNVDRDKFPIDGPDCLVSNLQVLHTPAGYYLGRICWVTDADMPGSGYEDAFSRETEYMTQEEAERALASGNFEVRECPENNLGYAEGLPHPKGVPAHEFIPKVAEEVARFKHLNQAMDKHL